MGADGTRHSRLHFFFPPPPPGMQGLVGASSVQSAAVAVAVGVEVPAGVIVGVAVGGAVGVSVGNAVCVGVAVGVGVGFPLVMDKLSNTKLLLSTACISRVVLLVMRTAACWKRAMLQ
jgi:hypothetical protein